MDFSSTNTTAVVTAVIGIAVIVVVRVVLELVDDRYEALSGDATRSPSRATGRPSTSPGA